MVLIHPEDIAGPDDKEEARHNIIAEAVVGGVPVIPGVNCVRDISPLVMLAMQRANNPFITNRKGFEAIGIEFDQKGHQVTDPATFALLLMPKVAEVLVLVSCTRDELKQFAVSPSALLDAALGLMDKSTMEDLAAGMLFVSEKLQKISKTRAAKSPEDDKPGASALEEANNGGKKKHGRTGSPKS